MKFEKFEGSKKEEWKGYAYLSEIWKKHHDDGYRKQV